MNVQGSCQGDRSSHGGMISRRSFQEVKSKKGYRMAILYPFSTDLTHPRRDVSPLNAGVTTEV